MAALSRFDGVCAKAVELASDANTSASTAAYAACFAGEIACVWTSNVDRNEECRNSSCITLNSVPTLRSRVENVCRYVCQPNRF